MSLNYILSVLDASEVEEIDQAEENEEIEHSTSAPQISTTGQCDDGISVFWVFYWFNSNPHSVTDQPTAHGYLQRNEFTSEIFKIVIKNLPSASGIGSNVLII
jgi:hypothetical protein